MDWYYPVLGGAVRGAGGRAGWPRGWDEFVEPGLGRALRQRRAVGHRRGDLRAGAWRWTPSATGTARWSCTRPIQHLRDADGAYWTGWQFANQAALPGRAEQLDGGGDGPGRGRAVQHNRRRRPVPQRRPGLGSGRRRRPHRLRLLHRQFRLTRHGCGRGGGFGGGALGYWAAAQQGLLDGGRVVGHVEPPDVGAGRHDGVDPVEHLVGQDGAAAGEQVVEVIHRARSDDRRGHARVRDREGHRQVGQRHPGFLGDGDQLLDDIEPALVAQVLEAEAAPVRVGLLALAVAAGEQAPASGLQTSVPMP